MASLSGFRPPQFSEDDAWLPAWLQSCNGGQIDVEGIKDDHVTFEQRVEELLCLGGFSNRESSTEEGGCNIGQLFISGTESSPFSWAQSADNVVQFNLCLSSDGNSCHSLDGNSANSTPTTAAHGTDTYYPIAIQPLETLENLGQDTNLSTSVLVDASYSQTTELERHVDKNGLLKHDGTVNFSEAADEAVELCIAASEALVINEVFGSDSSEKSCSASATLEASLQLKQARLEVWRNAVGELVSTIGDVDDLSDLDDITMESAYKDAGVNFTELPENELSVSQVKDTLESEYDEELEHKKTGTSASNSDKSCNYNNAHRMESVVNNNIQSGKDLVADCGIDTQKKVICIPVCDLGTDVGFKYDCSRTLDDQAKFHLSVSAEKVNTPTTERSPLETNVRSSSIMSCRDGEKDNCLQNIVHERFQSRWFGGWTSNNGVRYSTVKRSIPEPFVGETSFFSESVDDAPDENSFARNNDKGAIIASQLSIPSQIFLNRAKDGVLLSQDVGSSSASWVDPLCSVVPCSISENVCSTPATNNEDPVLSRHLVSECKKYNVLETTPLDNMPAEGERMDRHTADVNDSLKEVSRRFTSLRSYSTLLPSHIKFSEEDGCQKRSLFTKRNFELTLQEASFSIREETVQTVADLPVTNKENGPHLSVVVNRRTQRHLRASISSMHNFSEKNRIGAVQAETSVKCLPCDNPHWKLSQCKNQSAQKFPASKRVRFSEKETAIPENEKFWKVQTASKPSIAGSSTRAAKRSTRSSHLESKARHLGKHLRNNLDKEKKRLIFQNMEFLLTGFSQQKEKEIEDLVRKYGGVVLSQVPSMNLRGNRSYRLKSQILPVVLCLKKIQSFKFLYGCAVNAYVLRVNWLVDSTAAGFVLPLKRYMILSRNDGRRHDQVYTAVKYNTHSLVFNNLGIMIHGKTKYFTNITTIIKHAGGQVFKTLQQLVQNLENGSISMGVVVADETGASRHLKHCALEQNTPMTSVYWIIKCLYAGKLIPLEEKKNSRCLPTIKLQRQQDSAELSQEI